MAKKRIVKRRGRAPDFRVEALEPRLLFSADAAFIAAESIDSADNSSLATEQLLLVEGVETSSVVDESSTDTDDVATSSEANELVVIDANVPNVGALVSDFTNREHPLKVIVLQPGKDGLSQLGDILLKERGLSALHLISHGTDGVLELGGEQISTLDLLARTGDIAAWRNAFTDDADLLIYGCDVAASTDGQNFVNTLARLTHTDVAASRDITGSSANGGDWQLEYAQGEVTADVVVSDELQSSYEGVFATYTVSNFSDSGASNTLRWAITQINAGSGGDTIDFSAGGTIALLTPLPEVTQKVVIDAFAGLVGSGPPVVTLDGASMTGTDQNGLTLGTGSDESVVRGLTIINMPEDGIHLNGASNVTIESNYIGTDGTVSQANGGAGINLLGSSNGNFIGGAGVGNLISGNSDSGINLDAGSANSILGNLIGTDATGLAPLGNSGWGIKINTTTSGILIGSAVSGEGNTISGNDQAGISISGSGSGHIITGNIIGLGSDGDAEVGNGTNGIYANAAGITIGGGALGEGNVISANDVHGIALGASADDTLIYQNIVGLDATGTLNRGNNGNGISIDSGANRALIGGDSVSGFGNVISGNAWSGILVQDSNDTVIQGNRIGTTSDGSAVVANGTDGILVTGTSERTEIGGSGSGESNQISGNVESGIDVDGADVLDTEIKGNLIGTNAAGSAVLVNGAEGIYVHNGATDTRIGGDFDAGEGNLISGHTGSGVKVGDEVTIGTWIQGNYIGTDDSGATALANQTGVEIDGAVDTLIGGLLSGEGNLISGNILDGIHILGSDNDSGFIVILGQIATNTQIYGNRVGTTANGLATNANGRHGVYIEGDAQLTLIGGATAEHVNLISGNAESGIRVEDGNNTTIFGNLLGTDETGNAPLANNDYGIDISGTAVGTLVGSDAAGTGNVVSGNQTSGIGITESSTGTVVAGNYVGLGSDGVTAVPNAAHGIFVNALGVTVGGTTSGSANYVGANASNGILLSSDSDSTEVLGNVIGLDATGVLDRGNGDNGIQVDGATNMIIGAAGAGNTVAWSGQAGIKLSSSASSNSIVANRIGTAVDGVTSAGNDSAGIVFSDSSNSNTVGGTSISAANIIQANTGAGIAVESSSSDNNTFLLNLIAANGGLGIDLGTAGVDANDTQDPDTGANNLQNYPVLNYAMTNEVDAITVRGSMDTTASTDLRIDIYASVTADGSGYGEAERYLGVALITTDASGAATFSESFTATVAFGESITATATVLSSGVPQSTSEFSQNITAALNSDPVSVDDPDNGAYAAFEDTLLTVTATNGVLSNDSDVDNESLSAELVTGPSNAASFTLNADGSFSYRANAEFSGTDSFVYRASDGTNESAVATATITVAAVNDAPAVIQLRQDAVAAYDFDSGTDSIVAGGPSITVDAPVAISTGDGYTTGSDGLLFDVGDADNTTNPVSISAIPGVATSNEFSFSAQIRFDVGEGNRASERLFDFGAGETDNNVTLTRIGDSDDLRVIVRDSSTTLGNIDVSNVLSGIEGEWHHFGVTVDATGFVGLYMDGVVIGSTLLSGIPDYSVWTNNYIGSSSWTSTKQFQGAMDDIGIFDRALSSSEMASLANTSTAQSFSVAENSAQSTRVGFVHGGDADGDALSYSIQAQDNAGAFAIDSSSGEITVADSSLLDFEVQASHNITVRVTDSASAFQDEVIVVEITDVNDAPVITSNLGGATGSVTVAENQTTVTTVEATDADDSDTQTYSISGGADQSAFVIDGTSGVLTFASAPNHEVKDTYEVEVTVTDSGTPGLTDVQMLTVTVSDVNEAPEIISNVGWGGSLIIVAENQTTVTTVVATDVDDGDTQTYSISGGADQSAFVIDGTSGDLTFASAPDHEVKDIYEVEVTVTDSGTPGLTDVQMLTVIVSDVNEAPEITSNLGGATGSVTVAENQTTVTTVEATDVDDGDTQTYSISDGADQSAFAIDDTSGELTFVSAPDYEVEDTYEVEVTVTDSGTPGLTDVQMLTVTVSDVNDAPIIVQLRQDAVAAYDFDSGTDSIVTGGPSITVDAPVAISTGDGYTTGSDGLLFDVGDADSSTNPVSISTIPNVATTGEFSFSAQVRFDVGSGDKSWERIFDFGGGSSNNNVLLARQSATDNLALSVRDGAQTLGTIVISNALSGIEGAWHQFGVTLDVDGLAVVYMDGVAIGSKQLSGTPDYSTWTSNNIGSSNWSANKQFQGAMDDIGIFDRALSSSEMASLANTSTTQNFSVAENSANATSVGFVYGGDAEGDTLSYSIEGQDYPGAFSINASDGEITVADGTLLDFEAVASHNVTVRVTDTSSLFSDAVVVIGISNVNEAPSISTAASISADENQTSVVTITSNDVEGDSVTYAITGGDDSALFSVGSISGDLTFDTAPDFETLNDDNADGIYEVEVTANDGSLDSDAQLLSITVSNVNDAPTDMVLGQNFDGTADDTFSTGLYFDNPNSFTLQATVSPTQTITLPTEKNSGTAGSSGGNRLHAYVVHPDQGLETWGSNDSVGLAMSVGINGVAVYEYTSAHVPSLLTYSGTIDSETEITLVLDNKTPSLYLNGVFVKTGLTSTKTDVYPSVNDIGGANFGKIVGQLSELHLWDSAVSAADVPNLIMNVHSGETDGLLFSTLQTFVPENTANGTEITTVNALDQDVADTLSYTLIDNASGRFALDANTGTITVANSTLLDYEAAESHDIVVEVSDGSLTYIETLTIKVSAVNEAPELALNAGLTITQGSSSIITSTMLSATDVDDVDTTLAFHITTEPVEGQIESTNNPGVALTSFTVQELQDSEIVYASFGNSDDDDSFVFEVRDGGEDFVVFPSATFVIGVNANSVNAINDTFTVIASAPIVIDPIANDVDVQGDALFVIEIIDTAGSDASTLLASAGDTAILATGTTVALRSDGRLDVVAFADGTESFDYRASDSSESDRATVTLNTTSDQATAEAIGFVTTWDTTRTGSSADDTLVLTVNDGSDDYTIYWGDGTSTTGASGDVSHTYAASGVYSVAIVGDFAGFGFNDSGDVDKLISIEQWGNVAFEDWTNGFEGASALVDNAIDAPDLEGVTSLADMFKDSSFNGAIGHWDVSGIEDMSGMFDGNGVFNQDITGWDTGSVTNLSYMFKSAVAFNQDINTVVGGGYNGGTAWNTSAVEEMNAVFQGASAFDGNISAWDTSNVWDMGKLFQYASAFNADISNWDVSSVQYLDYTFRGASSFNQNVGGWETGNVETMSNMFGDAISFNQDINTVVGGGNSGGTAWDTSSVETMDAMFRNASLFDGDISGWDTSLLTSTSRMFEGATVFNQNVGAWETGSITSMNYMFQAASAFNQDISGWNTISLQSGLSMFNGASQFDRSLGDWDISSVTDLTEALDNTGLSLSNYDDTLIKWSAQTVQSNVSVGALGLSYDEGAGDRQSLIDDHGWVFSDDIIVDTDGDTVGDYFDLDDDNDGLLDSLEQAAVDTDGDGVVDRKDLDSDNDGISDIQESGADVASLDTYNDGVINGAAFVDADSDGLADAVETAQGEDTGTPAANSDSDGLSDYLDLDSDNDGISDWIEAQDHNSYVGNDGDVSNDDLDGDGIISSFDSNDTSTADFGGTFSSPLDTDNNGQADYIDSDTDGDARLDVDESGLSISGSDANGDGIDDHASIGASYADPDGAINDPAADLNAEYRSYANNAPVVTGLDGAVSYVENGSAVVLDALASVTDWELDSLNNGDGDYTGAQFTIGRTDAIDSDDVFGFADGNGLSLVSNEIVKAGEAIASFDTSNAGELVLTFLSGATQVPTTIDASSILKQLTYENASDSPPPAVQLDWLLDDGNIASQGSGGALSATASMAISISATNDAPDDLALANPAGTNLLNNGSFETNNVKANGFASNVNVTVDSWTSIGEQGFEVWNSFDSGGPGTASDGVTNLELNVKGSSINGISQSVATIDSQTYVVSFDLSNRTSRDSSSLEIYWRGDRIGTIEQSAIAWQTHSFIVTGSGGTDELIFLETETNNSSGSALLDNVRLVAQNSPSVSVVENSANGTVVAFVAANDVDTADPADTRTFTLTDSATGRFDIDSETGVVTVADDTLLDYEADTSHSITIRVTDTVGDFYEETFSIAVTDVSNLLIVDTSVDNNDSGISTDSNYDIEWLNINKGADGLVSLREAIYAANNTAGVDAISFDISGLGVHTIDVLTALPAITDAVVLDASTDFSFAANINRPAIILDGNNAFTGDGLTLSSGAGGSSVRGLVIRDFDGSGIVVESGADNVSLLGNYVGALTTNGSSAGSDEANTGTGIVLESNANVVGGTDSLDGNVVSGNNGNGIAINGGSNSSNSILGNSIFGNTGLGIDLDVNGATLNDAGDADVGANNLQNFPVLSSANSTGGNLTIKGTFNSSASTNYRIEFFSSDTGDATGHGEGQTFLGFANISTDASSNATIDELLTGVAVSAGHVVSATATVDLGGGSYGDTSEFSANVIATDNTAPTLDISPSPVVTSIDEDAGGPVGGVGTLISSMVDFATPSGQVDNVSDPDAGAVLGIAITDVDTDNGQWHYTLDGGTNWNQLSAVSDVNALLLSADTDTRVYFEPLADYNGSPASSILFRAWDQTSGVNGGFADTSDNGVGTAFSTDTDEALLSVTAVNDAPIITTASAFSAQENQTVVATLASSDVEGDTVTYAISGGVDAALFSVGTTSGELTFNTAPDFEMFTDSDTDGVYEVEVTANDGANDSAAQLITITVTDVNEAPDIITGTALSAAENQTAVVTLASTDPETDTVTYTISGGADQMLFNVDTSSGELTFVTAPDFETFADNDTDGVYEVEVTANDGNLDSAVKQISVTVIDVNEAPTLVFNTGMTITQGDTALITSVMLAATDIDDADNTLEFHITTAALQGQIESTINSGVPLTSFTLQQLQDSEIVYVSFSNSDDDDSFIFEVRDGGEDSVVYPSATFTIVVNDNSVTAIDDTYTIIAGAPSVINPLENDVDLQADVLSAIEVIDTAAGDAVTVLVNTDDTATLASGSTVSMRADGRLEVIAFADGVESFDYRVSDGADTERASITLNITSNQATAEAIGFVTTWDTTRTGSSADDTLALMVNSGSDNYTIFWGDGASTTGASGNVSHTYAAAGNYTVAIVGDFAGFGFNGNGDIDKLTSIEQWGNVAFENWANGFEGASALIHNAIDAPDLTDVVSLTDMFRNTNFNGAIGHWDVSGIEDMSGMFMDNTVFNQDISGWETGNVSSMSDMFNGAESFNQDINTINGGGYNGGVAWDTSSVNTMKAMFSGALVFDGDISGWDTSLVADMQSMFYGASAFNQNIGGWETGSVSQMSNMFRDAAAFNQSINTAVGGGNSGGIAWDTSNVTSMQGVFRLATDFNADISDWDTSLVATMEYMFFRAPSFNQDVTGWETGSVTNINDMFRGAVSFNQDINTVVGGGNQGGTAWDTSALTAMRSVFMGASVFDGNISGWDTSSVIDMTNLFLAAPSFNQDISGWNTASLQTANGMLREAILFNQSLGDWNVESVTDLTQILDNTDLSITNYNDTLIKWAAQNVQSNVPVGAAGLIYDEGAGARQSLIDDHGWTFASDIIVDTDGDTVGDYFDVDDDNDGLLDTLEQYAADTDGDGIVDRKDLDSDNDGISDILESGADVSVLDSDSDGVINGAAFVDADNDGLADAIEALQGADTGTPATNSDSDILSDYQDLDSDNDGIADWIEAQDHSSYMGNDGDVSDNDSDGDGVISNFDNNDTTTAEFGGTFTLPLDTDGDGQADYIDTDTDGDARLDENESGLSFSGIDINADGIDDHPSIGASYADPDGVVNDPAIDLNVEYRSYANNAPVVTGLDGTEGYTEDGPVLVLDLLASVADWELDSLNSGDGDYAGAQFTIGRAGAINSDDVFGFVDGNGLSLVGDEVVKAGEAIASFDVTTAGELVLTFGSGATQVATSVDASSILSQLSYENPNNTPPASVQMDWVFNDGNISSAQGTGGALVAAGSNSIVITSVNDAPTIVLNTGATLIQGATTSISSAMLLAADVDDVDSTLEFHVTTEAVQGQIESTLNSGVALTSFTLQQVQNDEIVYASFSNSDDDDSFVFEVRDGGEDSVVYPSATFTIVVNDNSVTAIDDTYTIIAGAPSVINPLENDVDLQADVLSVIEVIDTAAGDAVTVLVNTDDTATLASGSTVSMRADGRLEVIAFADGIESFDYRVSDGAATERASITLNIASDQATAEAIGFVTTWDTTRTGSSADDTLALMVNSGSDNYTIFWGDGTSTTGASGNVSHTYAAAGNYTVAIVGDFAGFGFDGNGDVDKLTSVEQWGNVAFENWANGLEGASALVHNAIDAPDLTDVTSLADMFRNTSFNGAIGHWDVSGIEDMSGMFMDNAVFNQDISGWETGSVISMGSMFNGAMAFDHDINTVVGGGNNGGTAWDTSSVNTMQAMFSGASLFDSDINDWNTALVTDMQEMFFAASNFNQDISGWETGSVTLMNGMFRDAISFNQDINTVVGGGNRGGTAWDTSSVSSMESMFRDAATFDGNISRWDISSVSDLRNMFWGALSFNQNISGWEIVSATSMESMFRGAEAFNQEINTVVGGGNNGGIAWDTSGVVDVAYMFSGASAFDGSISSWDTSSITTMNSMFFEALIFNQNISSWNTESLQNASMMLSGASQFNQSLGNWNVASITDLNQFLDNTKLSISNYDDTLIKWAAQNVKSNVAVGVTGLLYDEGAGARQSLIDNHNWTFAGDIIIDTDGDAVGDYYDVDDDNDGLLDTLEQYSVDTDGDGIVDRKDLDSDNDGISDLEESGVDVILLDSNSDGVINGLAFVDDDSDGLSDAIELIQGADAGTPAANTDNDGLSDYRDIDSDNDGISDWVEAQDHDSYVGNDGDVSDDDSDGDGIIASFDSNDTTTAKFGGTFISPLDTDGDGQADYIDTDADGDARLDANESGLSLAGSDTNADGIDDHASIGASYADPDGEVNDPITNISEEYRSYANNAPVVVGLDGEVSYTEDGPVILLDVSATVADRELDSLNNGEGNYTGAMFTVARVGVPNNDDVFGFVDGNAIALVGGNLIKNEQAIASFDTTTTVGELTIVFRESLAEYPSTGDVQNIVRQISYENSNNEPEPNVTIEWQLYDGNVGAQGTGGELVATNSILIDITAANDAPVVTPIDAGVLIYTENTGPMVISSSLTLSDPDDAQLESAIIQISTNYTSDEDVLSFTDQYGITGAWNSELGQLTLTGSSAVENYEAALRSITYSNYSEDPSIELRTVLFSIDDGNISSNTHSTDIQVIPENDVPVVISGGGGSTASISIAENTLAVTTVVATDSDHSSGVQYTLSGGSDVLLFSLDRADGTLVFKVAPDYEAPGDLDENNQYQITVRATDTAGGFSEQAISLSVNDINESPQPVTDYLSAVEDTALAINVATDLLANDTDPEADELEIIGFTQPMNGVLVSTLDGMLSYQPDIDYHGVDSFDYRVKDAVGNTATATVILNVESVNDAPVLAIVTDEQPEAPQVDVSQPLLTGGIVAIVENEERVGVVAVFDVDGDDVDLSLEGLDANLFTIDSSTGEISSLLPLNYEFPADSDGDNDYEFEVVAKDTLGEQVSIPFTITTLNVNEAPELVEQEFALREGFTGSLGQLTAIDQDTGDTLEFELVSVEGPFSGSVTILPNGVINTSLLVPGIYEIGVSVRDNQGLVSMGSVVVVVKPYFDGAPVLSAALPSQQAVEIEVTVSEEPEVLVTMSYAAATLEEKTDVSESTNVVLIVDLGFAGLESIQPLRYANQVDQIAGETSAVQDIREGSTIQSREVSASNVTLISVSYQTPPTPQQIIDLLERVRSSVEEFESEGEIANNQMKLVVSVGGVAVSLGFVGWLVSSRLLLAATLSTVSLWRSIDPFPVLLAGDCESDNNADDRR